MKTVVLNINTILIFTIILISGSSARFHSFEEDVSLTAKQREILDKFKEQVSSHLPHDYMKEDIYLIRWLRSRNFNLKNAEIALMQNMKWRSENGMDNILEEDFSDFESNYKYWLEGRDREGKPFIYFDIATHDARKAIVAGKSARYLRYVDRMLEQSTVLIRELGVKYQNVTRGHLVVNMDGYNIVQHGCLQCTPIILRMLIAFQEHYPNYGDGIILLNTPTSVEPFINVLKTVLNPDLRDSIYIFGPNKEHYKRALGGQFDFNLLPPQIGGNKLYEGMLDEF